VSPTLVNKTQKLIQDLKNKNRKYFYKIKNSDIVDAYPESHNIGLLTQ